MASIKPFVVMTTIAPPTLSAINIISKSLRLGYEVVVVGDRKTPEIWTSLTTITYIPWKEGELTDSYARKNLGYKYAMEHGATHIFDIDDDNDPLPHWGRIKFSSDIAKFCSSQTWVNVYNLFGDESIWPRGLPLHAINDISFIEFKPITDNVKVWQSLCSGEPDTDAIWRLLNTTKSVYFSEQTSVVLEKNTICPFNAQNTLFMKEAFSLLYLPSSVNMRFSDILRSIIAQPILWNAGYQIGFTESTVMHRRNKHDLMKDFYDELQCYANVEKVYNLTTKAVLNHASMAENLLSCYVSLAENGIVSFSELNSLYTWFTDTKYTN